MDRTRLEGAQRDGAFTWHNGGIPMEPMIAVLVKVSSDLDKVHRMKGEL